MRLRKPTRAKSNLGMMSAPSRRYALRLALGAAAMPFAVLHASRAADAADWRSALSAGPDARIREVIDGDTVRLDDGSEVRLIGLQAPKLSLGRDHVSDWPHARDAKAALEGHIARDPAIRLWYGQQRRDRHGRILAHLERAHDGRWVQGEMLKFGWARVYTFPDNRLLAGEMLALERAARLDAQGIWRHPFYAVRDVRPPIEPLEHFHIVRGRVRSAALVRDRLYINFGDYWKEDVTASVAPDHFRDLRQEWPEPQDLEARSVEIRGWVYERDGPMIELTHPEQIVFV